MIDKMKFEEDLLELLKKHGIKTDNLTSVKIFCNMDGLVILPTYVIGESEKPQMFEDTSAVSKEFMKPQPDSQEGITEGQQKFILQLQNEKHIPEDLDVSNLTKKEADEMIKKGIKIRDSKQEGDY